MQCLNRLLLHTWQDRLDRLGNPLLKPFVARWSALRLVTGIRPWRLDVPTSRLLRLFVQATDHSILLAERGVTTADERPLLPDRRTLD
jgi:hypothetical protein